ncbi:MAG TPA: class I SAM-dependent methyltransferase [Limnobacter sp.]|nr:class I SAM-dependent methyltransferase [Limnobacter sp.]
MGTLNRFNWAAVQQAGGFDQFVVAGGTASLLDVDQGAAGFKSSAITGADLGYALPKGKAVKRRVVYLDGNTAVELLAGMQALVPQLGAEDVLVLSRAWCFLNERFSAGNCPPKASAFEHLPTLQALLQTRADTHALMRSLAEDGYVLLIPKALMPAVREWFYLLPSDPNPKKLQLRANVPGVTSISLLRRVHDARFATRFFKGHGLDVGGGNDSLALYLEFFPLVRNLIVYEREQGDGQYLANVPDNAFDFVYSSHCLEHLVDPAVALGNWLRVLKPGGHLVFQVPDEDLYEQGVWPSRFNNDHKHTFTMAKAQSWSPVSINVLDLISPFRSKASVLSVALVDHGVRSRLLGKGVDQTRFPMAECGIEVVMQKLEH